LFDLSLAPNNAVLESCHEVYSKARNAMKLTANPQQSNEDSDERYIGHVASGLIAMI
jgi:hypothetical protein